MKNHGPALLPPIDSPQLDIARGSSEETIKDEKGKGKRPISPVEDRLDDVEGGGPKTAVQKRQKTAKSQAELSRTTYRS